MKRNILSLFCLAALLTACSADKDLTDDTNSGADGNVEVTFTIAMTNNTATTRATYEEEYDGEQGVLDENKIENLQVYLYSSDGTFLKKVDEIAYNQTSTSNIYEYFGTLKISELNPDYTANSTYTFNGKVVVLANCATYTPDAGSTLADFNPGTFTYPNTTTTTIPMWGVKTLTNQALTPNIASDFGDIYLLRAMAKVEIQTTDLFRTNGFTIDKISLSRYNTTGNVLPAGAATTEYTKALDIEGCKNIPTDATESTTELTFSSTTTDGITTWYAYMPEFATTGDGETCISVVVNKTGNTGTDYPKTYKLYFADYDNETSTVENVTASTYDIIRNHVYRYTLNKEADEKLEITYQAMPWTLIENEIGWNVQFTFDGTRDYEAQNSLVFRPGYETGSSQHTLKYGVSDPSFRFTLSSPVGATWYAQIEDGTQLADGSTVEFQFMESRYSSNKYRCASMGITRPDRYYDIRVAPKQQYSWIVLPEDGSDPTYSDYTVTDYGKEAQSLSEAGIGVYTDLSIYVVTANGHKELLKINPTGAGGKFKGGKLYAGPDEYHVRIFQVEAIQDADYEDILSGKTGNYGTLFSKYLE